MRLASTIHLASALWLACVSAQDDQSSEALHQNQANCSCYVVNTSNSSGTTDAWSQAFFQYHRFYDFRSLPLTTSDGGAPPLLSADDLAARDILLDSATFNSSTWNQDWQIQQWSKPPADDRPLAVQNAASNIYITTDAATNSSQSDDSRYLSLRTYRANETLQAIAEIDTVEQDIMYASVRFRARVRGEAGACAGLFTFGDDNDESDIEILTSDPQGTYRLTNQPSESTTGDDIPGSSIRYDNASSWNDWRTMRIDWLPGSTRWWIDGAFIAQNDFQVPTKPSGIVLNMWSNAGHWTGEMVWTGQVDAANVTTLDVQWVEVVYNTSATDHKKRETHGLQKREDGCTTVCSIDNVSTGGTPDIVYQAPPTAGAWMNLPGTVLSLSVGLVLWQFL